MKSYKNNKIIDCGSIAVDDHPTIVQKSTENQQFVQLNEDFYQNLKMAYNLSSCLADNLFSSFTINSQSKLTQYLFNKYFYLNDKSGAIYMRNQIDRETLCVQIATFKSRYKRDRSLSTDKAPLLLYQPVSSNFKHTTDFVDCDCQSEKCEIGFKFVAFKQAKQSSLSQEFKYLTLSISVQDSNDNNPLFIKNFLYLNISEHIGTKIKPLATLEPSLSPKYSCQNYARPSDDYQENPRVEDYYFLNSNNLIPIEKAKDLDVGKNAQIVYKLFLFRNTSKKLVEEIEKDRKAEKAIRMEIRFGGLEECRNKFELVESSLSENIPNYELSSSFINRNQLDTAGTLLFLKINTFLDREQQDTYNFLLVDLDKEKIDPNLNEANAGEFINERNYVLISLNINDLNDNQPVFSESKYLFNLNETTEFQIYYKDLRSLQLERFNSLAVDDNGYYYRLLEETCTIMRNKLRVIATDADSPGPNSQIKYKIMQQIHRKNPNINSNSHYTNSYQKESVQIDPDSAFVIDQLSGFIQLSFCNRLNGLRYEINRAKFLELTSILDFEMYIKHILVIEASDSNLYNPLQSVVTVELNLYDLNDNQPFLISLFSSQCARFGGIGSLEASDNTENVNISIQHFAPNTVKFKRTTGFHAKPELSYSSKIIIEGLSEFTRVGKCIGQFLITDLDTAKQNRRIEVIITPNGPGGSQFIINNVKNRDTSSSSSTENGFFNQTIKQQNSNSFFTSAQQTNEIFELFLNFEPDAEQERIYELTLEIKDHGLPIGFTSYSQLIVLVKDENDNEPKFSNNFYNFTVEESENKSNSDEDPYCFGQLEVHDLDCTEQNSYISYELNEIDVNSMDYKLLKRSKKRISDDLIIKNSEISRNFFIDEINSMICVRNRSNLDREDKNKYEFIVKAINSKANVDYSNNQTGKKRSFATANIVLNVKDVNDNQPQFLQKEYTFYVVEKDSNLVSSLMIIDDAKSSVTGSNAIKNLVGYVRATDLDIGPNAELVYYVSNSNKSSYFELNTQNPDNSLINDKNNVFINEKNSDLANNVGNKNVILVVDVENEEETYGDYPNEINDYVDLNDGPDTFTYQVRAIKHQPFEGPINRTGLDDELVFDYLNVSSNANDHKDFNKRKTKKKLFKQINRLDNLIYVNSSTGAIYLLQKIDREQIINIRFYVFVRDKGEPKSLNASVPVIIEIIDMNDSKPICKSALSTLDTAKKRIPNRDSLDSISIRIDTTKFLLDDWFRLSNPSLSMIDYEINTNWMTNFSHSIEIYRFKCIDNDLNKNGEIKYEVEKFYLKNLKQSNRNEMKNTEPKIVNKFRTIDYETGTSGVFQTLIPLIDHALKPNIKLLNEYVSTNKIFHLNIKSGKLYLNISSSWLNFVNNKFSLNPKFKQYFENRTLIVKVKVSDNGMVSLYNNYYLKFHFCFDGASAWNENNLNRSSNKYCDFSDLYDKDRRNAEKPILIKNNLPESGQRYSDDNMSIYGNQSEEEYEEDDEDNEDYTDESLSYDEGSLTSVGNSLDYSPKMKDYPYVSSNEYFETSTVKSYLSSDLFRHVNTNETGTETGKLQEFNSNLRDFANRILNSNGSSRRHGQTGFFLMFLMFLLFIYYQI